MRMRGMLGAGRLLWFERFLLCAGLLAGLALAVVQVQVLAAQRAAEVEIVRGSPAAETGQVLKAGDGAVIGRLEIRALTLSVPVLSDIDAGSLRRGVGKVRGTANAGGLGNMVLAGHRDTFFRPLRRISAGTELRVGDGRGMYRYVVDRTEIVGPAEVNVLTIGDRPELTLITCFPFEYVGAAPQRFIVHAHLVSALASSD